MSLILSTGSNIGDRVKNLLDAKEALSQQFKLNAQSNIYASKAVDYTEQPDFLNQVLEFDLPEQNKKEVLKRILKIEKDLGRVRNIDKGPRTIDIDILFWSLESFHDNQLSIPHPRLFERSFIVLPVKELPFFQSLNEYFTFPAKFNNSASIYKYSSNDI